MSAKTVEDIALTLIPGIGVKGVVHLLEVFGSAERVFAASEEELAGRAEDYRPQLEAYSRALSQAAGVAVKRRYLWFFSVGRAVEL